MYYETYEGMVACKLFFFLRPYIARYIFQKAVIFKGKNDFCQISAPPKYMENSGIHNRKKKQIMQSKHSILIV